MAIYSGFTALSMSIFSNILSSKNSLPTWRIRTGWIKRWLDVLSRVFIVVNYKEDSVKQFGCNKRLY